MASIGLPGTSGFVGEFLVIVGALQVNFWLALLGGLGMILGAIYMLYLYRRVIFGRLTKDDLRGDPRSVAARDRGVRAAGRADAVDGHLSVQLHQLLRCLGGAMVQHHAQAMAASDARRDATRHVASWPNAVNATSHSAPSRPGADRVQPSRCEDPRLMNWTLALPEIVLADRWHGDPDLRRAAQAATTRSIASMLTLGGFLLAAHAGRSRATPALGFNGQFVIDRVQPVHEGYCCWPAPRSR